MKTLFQIRPLETTDSIGELTSLLHRAYARLGQMGLNYTAVDQTPEVTSSRIRGGHCFVVTAAHKLVGTIVVQPTYRQSACEYFMRLGVAAAHQFAVDPDYQGSGIGRMLLQRAEQWATAAGFAELAIDTAEPAKHLSWALYPPRLPSSWPCPVARQGVSKCCSQQVPRGKCVTV